LVLDATLENGFVGPGYFPLDKMRSLQNIQAGWPDQESHQMVNNSITAPCSFRAIAAEYHSGEPFYAYNAIGGIS
jgi:hypothetical protein